MPFFQALNSLHKTGGGKGDGLRVGIYCKVLWRYFARKKAPFLNVKLMLHAVKAKAHLPGFSLIVVFVLAARGHTLNSK